MIEQHKLIEKAFRAGFEAGMDYAYADEFPVSCADVPNEDRALDLWLNAHNEEQTK